VIDAQRNLRQLRVVLQRLGAQSVSRYWSSESRVFLSNFFGGAATGAAAFIFAALLLGLDIHRGENSFVVHLIRAAQAMVSALRQLIDQRL
jgi:hypothetical protein